MKRILTLSAALLLVGCSQIPDPPAPQASDADPQMQQTQAPPEEDITLHMAVLGSLPDAVQHELDAYNAEDNHCHIETVDYMQYISPDDMDENGTLSGREALSPAALHLQMDILSGEAMEIVPDSAFAENLGHFEVLLQKGAFCDLYPFMAQDDEVNTDTLDAHVLALHETDGELRCLPLLYTVGTLLGDPAYVGETENWTFAQMQSAWEAAPEGLTFNHANATKDYVYYTVLRDELGGFVDYETVSCRFDSPEFVQMLQFCNSFPETPPEKTDVWDAHDFVFERTVRGFQDFHTECAGSTLVGYPSEDGQGAFLSSAYYRMAVCRNAAAPAQEAAWQYLRRLALEPCQKAMQCEGYDEYGNLVEGGYDAPSFYNEIGFPVNRAAYTQAAALLTERAAQGVPNAQSMQGTEYDEGWFSQEECDHLNAYIAHIDRLDTSLDYSLVGIVQEEIFRMFDGVQTPEECARAVQSRAQIMVSEQS